MMLKARICPQIQSPKSPVAIRPNRAVFQQRPPSATKVQFLCNRRLRRRSSGGATGTPKSHGGTSPLRDPFKSQLRGASDCSLPRTCAVFGPLS
ncbi:hypothetical protein RHMOL_Rhmol12G0088100 [Rhododendron molle]|uniref:Uncharacterized protein n=1 Tax=Rhododendron molle TaxID=49168 RepID=A0ACC0LHJ1_RHOML|nr:hypothetical protein RHMOL_Rhmol12G0088100 [Rhododendron molle]